MGAPTWPPTPEEAARLTLEEYGAAARAVMARESDDDAERGLLAPFLYGPPPRELVSGEAVGTTLGDVQRTLQAWTTMVTGTTWPVEPADPAATDGHLLFLPRALPPPAEPEVDRLIYRAMTLIQIGLVQFGFLRNRGFIAELHRDWVLRNTYHLLAARAVIRIWSQKYPGVGSDFRAIRVVGKAGRMRLNLLEVPTRGMPAGFRPLYNGMVDFIEGSGRPDPIVTAAVEATDHAPSIESAPLVAMGQAKKVKAHFHEKRLGAPPLPYFLGIIRPEWILHSTADIEAEITASAEWKKGPKPLQMLLKAQKRTQRKQGRLSRIRSALQDNRGQAGPPQDIESALVDPAMPSQASDVMQYEEWNCEKGIAKQKATRVSIHPAPKGDLDRYMEVKRSHMGPISDLSRQLNRLFPEERWIHRQQDGSDLDIDRAIQASLDLRAGHTPRRDWHMNFVRQRDPISVLVMMDLSSSTQGRVMHHQQGALVVLMESLHQVDHAQGFPHALVGFQSFGAQDCRLTHLKGWDETLNDSVRARFGDLRSEGATRLGAFVRHGAWMLTEKTHGPRLLLLLSDGMPRDLRGHESDYQGRLAEQDTAIAVRQARATGVHVTCVSLAPQQDQTANLGRVFGENNCLQIDRLEALPHRLGALFAQLVGT